MNSDFEEKTTKLHNLNETLVFCIVVS